MAILLKILANWKRTITCWNMHTILAAWLLGDISPKPIVVIVVKEK